MLIEKKRKSFFVVCHSSRAGYFWSDAPLARMRINRFNCAALLDFPNVIRPNESNPDTETSHFAAVWSLKEMYPWGYKRLF